MDEQVKSRYNEKIRAVGSVDPYSMKMNGEDIPTTVSTGQVVDYLLNHRSPFSGNPVNTRKGLQAYEKFASGFVQSVEGLLMNNLFVVRGKVHRSMRLSEKPHVAWIIIEMCGAVQSAHCQCPVGVTESCSHVAAILYALANLHWYSINEKITPTDVPAYWLKPSKGIKEDLYNRVADIDYGYTIKRYHDAECKGATEEDFADLVKRLKQDNSNAAVIRKFCTNEMQCNRCDELYVPDEMLLNKSILIQNMFDANLQQKSLQELRQFASLVVLQLNPDDIAAVEKLTRRQSADPFWRHVRIGRITASIVREVVNSSVDTPPAKLSLLKKICHPYLVDFDSAATKYGRTHEARGKDHVRAIYKNHDSAVVKECGIFLYQDKPYLAASPDLMVDCACCGKTCIEIKCPYRLKSTSNLDNQLTVSNLAQMKNSFIELNEGVLRLVRSHSYYYQVQAQIHITNSDQGLFVIWSKQEQVELKVQRDPDVWLRCVLKSEQYFRNIICPELLANYFTNLLAKD